MLDRRQSPRSRFDEVGSIAVDEHTSLPCIVYDLSQSGVRLTLPGTDAVPQTFVLTAPCIEGARICMVAWRDDETIGAHFRQRPL
ncbi:hypothetical protein ASG40_01515 [Methylobacterium sp. Leaf399]|uniref:PilZ domain-containing protein n=1 Tax=unclassified Methylobacterium TaxID=2615210 RepID=UPI0006F612DB|nr:MULTISPECIES: PilZ domain-containing protein [unclassified Methylobacterium]KQP61396.1 hypothetical protein ASF39_01520 [Methylobacterium sp. Leaf108]KQT20074.1 hypothetical protein ASG40_01515 [Methylobacterium sp. Leaf399]KQT80598.1 hypothetical protein ASG59_03950 [Methylobacterium sp. Leaf466]